ncbi:hypothetical protein, partial [Vibrio harveyi]
INDTHWVGISNGGVVRGVELANIESSGISFEDIGQQQAVVKDNYRQKFVDDSGRIYFSENSLTNAFASKVVYIDTTLQFWSVATYEHPIKCVSSQVKKRGFLDKAMIDLYIPHQGESRLVFKCERNEDGSGINTVSVQNMSLEEHEYLLGDKVY